MLPLVGHFWENSQHNISLDVPTMIDSLVIEERILAFAGHFQENSQLNGNLAIDLLSSKRQATRPVPTQTSRLRVAVGSALSWIM